MAFRRELSHILGYPSLNAHTKEKNVVKYETLHGMHQNIFLNRIQLNKTFPVSLPWNGMKSITTLKSNDSFLKLTSTGNPLFEPPVGISHPNFAIEHAAEILVLIPHLNP